MGSIYLESFFPPLILEKAIMKYRRPQIDKAILSEKSNAGGITIPTSNYTTEP
jgi:hypothetical protein